MPAWKKEKANSVRNRGGELLPYILSNGHKFWLVKNQTANKRVHGIRHRVYYLAQIQDKLKEESDSL